MLRCAASFVIAAYAKKVRLIPQDWRALPLELFTKPPQSDDFTDFLRERLFNELCRFRIFPAIPAPFDGCNEIKH
jgi:hypothetical protein